MREDRAVSDVVGFVLTFSIVVVAAGVVYVGGLGALEDFRDFEQANGAERSMETLASNFDELADGDPARASEIRLGERTISLESSLRVDVTVHESGGGTDEYEFAPGSVQYESSTGVVGYEAGGVFRGRGDRSVGLRPPTLSCTDERAILSIVELNATNATSVTRDGSVVVTGRTTSRGLIYPDDPETNATDAVHVDVDVTGTAHERAWTRFFETHEHWTVEGPSTYRCGNVERVYVRRTVVSIEFL
jgi:hypothetical protein